MTIAPTHYEILSDTAAPSFPTEWYDLGGDTHFWMRWRFAAFRALLSDARLKAIGRGLEIGCGAGVVQRQLKSNLLWTIDGCDLNPAALARNSASDVRIMLYNIFDRRGEFFEAYDFLILFDVIEHIADPVRFTEAALYHLKPGGLVFINVPALPWLYSRYDAVAGHFRRYTDRSLRNELSRSGVDVIQTRYWGLSLLPLAVFRKLLVARIHSDQKIIDLGFRSPSAPISAMLMALMKGEVAAIPRPPWGTSLLAIGRKPGF